jgi:hypothetical protein
VNGFAVGDKMTIGSPGETVTITAVGTSGTTGTGVNFMPALVSAHPSGDAVTDPGTGLDLATPLRFSHASNLPFADRGTGVSFQPATAFVHSSTEPVQALGTGITLDSPLAKDHAIDAVVRDAMVTTAGYQGTPVPNQWFGGPALSTSAGNMVLRDAAGLVVDSLNYGLLVDPWAAQGYQSASGSSKSGCRATAPGSAVAAGMSIGRFPDGVDTNSNCNDFLTQAAATLSAASTAGATNIKVASVEDFVVGERIMVDVGANQETVVVATVGLPGGTRVDTATDAGATVIPVTSVLGFKPGQTITVDSGAHSETAVVAFATRRGSASITVAEPLTFAHATGAQVSGSGITLASALTRGHAVGAPVVDNVPTPGAPNRYYRRPE